MATLYLRLLTGDWRSMHMKTSVRMALVFTIVLLMSTIVPLIAQSISITWEWDAADEEVVAFRYQVNAEDPEGWTVVDSSVTEFTVGPVDDTSYYTLYLQQSYDGENWSPSALVAYDPEEFGVLLPEPTVEPVVIDEPVVVAQPVEDTQPVEEPMPVEIPEEIVEPVTIVETAEAVEPEAFDDFVIAESEPTMAEELPEPTVVVEDPPRTRVDVYLGAGGKADNLVLTTLFDPNNDYANLRTRILPSISADFVYANMIPNESVFDFGLRAGVGLNAYQISLTGASLLGVDLHALAMFEYPINEKFMIDASVGLSFVFTGSAIHTPASSSLGLFIGPVFQLNGRYQLTDQWSIGAQAETRLLFGGEFKPYELSGIMRLGFGYSF